MLMVTLPLPLPADPEVTVMNEALLAAVQLHEPPPVTSMVAVPPAVLAVTVAGDTVKLQKAAVLKVATVEKSLVIVPFVARARQYQVPGFGPSSRSSVQLVVPLPCGMPSATRIPSGGNAF